MTPTQNSTSRIRSSSSALCALSSLAPPSPVLVASEMSVTWTSGEIPILLQSCSMSSILQVHNSASETESMSGIVACSSAETIDTICTFGPVQQTFGLTHTVPPRDKPNVTQATGSQYPDELSDHNQLESPMPFQCAGHQPLAFLKHVPEIGMPIAPQNQQSWSPYCNVDDPPPKTHPIPLHQEFDVDNGKMSNRFPPTQIIVRQSTSTPQSLPPLVSSAIFRPETVVPRTRRNLHTGTESASPKLVGNNDRAWSSPAEQPLLEVSVAKLASMLVHSSTKPHSESSHASLSPGRSRSPFPQLDRSPSVPSTASTAKHLLCLEKHGFPQEKLVWLKDVVVGILIDQEGFRAIHPSFKLAGYSSHPRVWKDHLHLPAENRGEEDDIAEFFPVKRESFNFHYTPLDSLPTLRRITVNGNESRDYISRQASLSLKTNGVYVVCGTETACSAIPGNGINLNHPVELPKLKWKFEYMVDDRRLDSTGLIMDGEKTLTPLIFSCSPALLLSQQGKKVGLMHVVLKSFIPNLTAEKMESPRPPLRSRPSASNLKATIQHTTSHYLAKSHAWVTHRRARSNLLQTEDQETLIESSTPKLGAKSATVGGVPKSPDDRSKYHMRRRRASSAGERTRNTVVAIDNVVPRLPRHIVPPAELSDMLSMNAEEIFPPRSRMFGYSTQSHY